jgi:hypothetical protein
MSRFDERIRGGVKPLSARRELAFGKRVDGPAGRRRAKRNPAGMRGELVSQTTSIDVTLIDMSNTGAKLHGANLPSVGQSVLVRIGPMEAFGTVAWREGDQCGIHFGSPASNEEVESARREQGSITLDAFGTGPA